MPVIEGPTTELPEQASELMDRIRRYLAELNTADDDQKTEDTVELAQEAYVLTSQDTSVIRMHACLLLQESLLRRSIYHANDSLLAEMIHAGREALTLCPVGHPYRAKSCGNLGSSLKKRYMCTGDIGLLVEATNLQREALALCPKIHLDRSKFCGNLATSLKKLYERTGDISLLDDAIDLQREVLALHPAGHPNRYRSCGNLANSLWTSYERTGDVGILDEVIDLNREAVTLCPAENPDHSLACGNLASTLKTRYGRTGDVGLLDEAIDLQRKTLALRPAGHPNRTFACNNLAISLKKLYKRTGDVGLLDDAIELLREALALRPAGHPYRSNSCLNLANTLWTSSERTGDVSLLKEAIDLQREALDLRPAGHPYRSWSCGDLAMLLKTSYERTGDVVLLYEILALLQEGVTISPAPKMWWHLTSLAVIHLQKAAPTYDVSKAILYLSQSLDRIPDETPAHVMELSSSLNHLWECNLEGKHLQLVTIYHKLVNVLPLLVSPALGVEPQLQALKKCTRLGSDAFVNAALADRWSVGLETLELAQGVIWSQSLHRRDPQLDNVPEHLASKLQDLLRPFVMNSAACPYGEDLERRLWLTPRDTLHAQTSLVNAVIQEIRALPGLDRFMLGETFKTLRTAASSHPVVVLVGARGYHYALIVAPPSADHALLALDLSDEDERVLSFTKGSVRQSRGGIANEPPVERAWNKSSLSPSHAVNRKLKALWVKIVKPVLDHLNLKPSSGQRRPRLHWCPTGIFSNFPLHAAGIYEGPSAERICCANFVVSSYTPTITTLLHAQKATTPLSRSDLSIALVAEKRAQDTNLPVLYDVDTEIEHVTAITRSSNVDILHRWVGSTTVEDTAKIMQAANIVHLACHGIQDDNDATQSGFCLGDGRLTIAKLMGQKLENAFLAFLSACETAKGDKDQPDQAMHLAAAMLFSGFKSVIATMWAICDADGPTVAKWFYEELFAKEVVDADSVAYALDSAAGKLRDSGVSPERWAPFIHMGA